MTEKTPPIAPTQQNEKIRKLAIDRIIDLEKELKDLGYRARFGVEVEFFVDGHKDGKPVHVPHEKLAAVRESLMGSRYVEDLREENLRRGWTSTGTLAAGGGLLGIVGGMITGEPTAGLIGLTVGTIGGLLRDFGIAENLRSGRIQKCAQYEINLGDRKAGEEYTYETKDGETRTRKRKYALGALKAAIATESIQDKLTTAFEELGNTNFAAKPRNDKLTSATHVNFSLMDEQGNNIFMGKGNAPSPMMRSAINEMVRIHRDGGLLFLPNENSHERIHSGASTPNRIGSNDNKLSHPLISPAGSVAARHAGWSGKFADAIYGIDTKPHHARGEGRLPGADCDPYLAMLGTLGAMVIAARKMKNKEKSEKTPPAALPKNLGESVRRFNESDHMKELLGKELHEAICEHYQAAVQSPSEYMKSGVRNTSTDSAPPL